MKQLFIFLILIITSTSFAQTYTAHTRVIASDTSANDHFGTDVDIYQNTMIAGAPDDGVSTALLGGSAYINELIDDTWSQTAKIRSSDSTTNRAFGDAVAIYGNFAVVGDPEFDTEKGAAYVFEKIDGTWTQIAKLQATVPTNFDRFGDAVEIDGNWIFIGAPKEEEDAAEMNNISWAGSVFVYKYSMSTSNWIFDHKMVPDIRTSIEVGNAQFGNALAADSGKLIVGAFGKSDSSASGPTTTNVGAVYLFNEMNGIWTQNTLMKAADAYGTDRFGYSVDLKGETAVVGALNHSYDETGANYKQNAGAAYYLTYNGTNWLAGGKLIWSDRDNGDYFGSSVAITPNQEKIIVGMYEENTRLTFDDEVYNKSECGAAVVYTLSSPGVYTEEYRLLPSILATQDNFGNAMAASESFLVVGIHQDDIEVNPNAGLCNLDVIGDNGAADIFKLQNSTAISEVENTSSFKLYPNPTNTYIKLSTTDKINTARILSVDGRVLKIVPSKDFDRIDVSDLSSGLYYIKGPETSGVPFVKY